MTDAKPAPATPPVTVTFSVRLSDKSFESELSIPVGAPEPRWQPVVAAWLRLMEESLKAQVKNAD